LAGSIFSYNVPLVLLPVSIALFVIQFFTNQFFSLKQAVFRTFIFFGAFHTICMIWFLQADVNGLIEVTTSTAENASLISLIVVVCFWTICSAPLAYLLYKKSAIQNHQNQMLVLLPSVWVLTEWIKSFGFSLFLYGPGATIGDYWNFGNMGMVFMNSPMSYASRFVGMYGLSFLFILSLCLFIKLLFAGNQKVARRYLLLFMMAIVGLSLASKLLWSPETANMKQASVLQIEKTTPNLVYETSIENKNDKAKDLIVLPEYSSVFQLAFLPLATTKVNNRLSSEGVSINVGEGDPNQRYGTLEFRDNQGAIVETQTKQLLIPTGEYLPNIITAFYKLSNQNYITETYRNTRQVHKGQPAKVFRSQNLIIGPVACSGILGRNIFRELTNDGAEVLTNSASLLIFNKSDAYFKQSLMMARFHAIANNRTYIQATKGASAFALDSNGKYLISPSGIETKFIDFEFSANKQTTLYNFLGEWFLIVSLLTLAGCISLNSLDKFYRKRGMKHKPTKADKHRQSN